MNDQKTQNTNGADTASAAAGDTDLDGLLNEFNEEATPKPGQPDVAGLVKGLEPLVRYVEEDKREKQAAQQQEVVDQAISFLKEEDALKEVDEEILHGSLLARYNKDEAFRSAHDNRGTDANAWSKALEGARKSLVEKVSSLPGNTVRSDVEAATAAVRGSSEQQSSDDEGLSTEDLNKMSDAEFERHKRQVAARG